MNFIQTDIDVAIANSKKWLEAFSLKGKPDIDKIKEVLNKRTFKGKPVTAVVVKSPTDALTYLKKLYQASNKANQEVIKNAYSCVWDYYLMAFYESAYSVLPNKDFEGSEFIKQSLFPAFEAGLGFVICLGPLLIGVCLPEAYRDEQLRIHRENGPAIIWGKKKEYWWHGTKVEKDWIEHPEKVDPALCLTWKNIEQRRCLCEILGWEKVVKQLKAKSIHTDEFGELLEVDIPDAGTTKFVRVQCPTGRSFCLPVDNSCVRAKQAVAMTYGVEENEYAPEFRT